MEFILLCFPICLISLTNANFLTRRTNYRGGGVVDCRYTYCSPNRSKSHGTCDSNRPCSDGSCCSYRGVCGRSDEFCRHGCQSNCQQPTTPKPVYNVPQHILDADIEVVNPWPDEVLNLFAYEDDYDFGLELNPEFLLEPGDDLVCGTEPLPSLRHIPWHVRLVIQINHKRTQCSGVLLNKRTILTAARCVKGARSIMAVLADFDTHKYDTFERNVSCHYRVHPYFNGRENDYDIAILTPCDGQLPIEYSDYIRPICLPGIRRNADFDKIDILGQFENTTISGWGRIVRGNKEHWRFWLSKVRTRILFPDVCQKIWELLGVELQPNALCSRSENCGGDVGSPLVGYWKYKAMLVGVTSFFNADCGKPHALVVFADVIELLGWIRREARGSLHFVGVI